MRSLFVSSAWFRCRIARQRNDKLGEYARSGLDLDPATVLFHDDVVAHRETQSSPLACWFGRRKGVEYLRFYVRSNSRAIVANADFDFITEAFRRGHKGRLEPVAALGGTSSRGIKSIRDQVEQDASNLLG